MLPHGPIKHFELQEIKLDKTDHQMIEAAGRQVYGLLFALQQDTLKPNDMIECFFLCQSRNQQRLAGVDILTKSWNLMPFVSDKLCPYWKGSKK